MRKLSLRARLEFNKGGTMEIHMIGHASLFVRTANLSILMDPVLWDPHQEGLFDVNPKREVKHDKLPPINLIILSHRHLDHFDIRSLAYLPKNAPILIPKDQLLEGYLRKLGFSKIQSLKDFTEVTIGATTLFTTRSENNVPEYGMVIQDGSGVFWNQVDSVVAPKTVEVVLSRFPQIDFLLACWQPMLETNFQTNGSLSFPYERYRDVLYNLSLASPRALAPGANAFCYSGGAAWMNHIVFPVTKDRFLNDVRGVLQNIGDNAFALEPGDVLLLEEHECRTLASGCDFVKRTGFSADLSFSPVNLQSRLEDDNPDGISSGELESTVHDIMESHLPDFIRKNENAFRLHHKAQVIYQLEVVFPAKTMQWNIDFRSDQPAVSAGHNSLANVFTSITSSSLHGIVSGARGWDYALLGGYCRNFHKLYSVTLEGILRADWFDLPDPLRLVYPYQQIFEKVLDRELERWSMPAEQARGA
jgi:hypothetical protein